MRLKQFWLDAPLFGGAEPDVPDDLRHRLKHVLRVQPGAQVALANGRDGLWQAVIEDALVRRVRVQSQLAPQPLAAGPTLVIGLPKREAWEQVLRQATELGVRQIMPLKTAFGQVGKLNPDRMKSLIREAMEQCERLTWPEVTAVLPLDAWLAQVDVPFVWLDARGRPEVWPAGPETLLVGPEGGFSEEESALLSAHPLARRVTFCTPVLRVETAVVAGLGRLVTSI